MIEMTAKSIPCAVAASSYPNKRDGAPGLVCWYPCPLCGRQHATLVREGEDSATTIPPCRDRSPRGGLTMVRVLPPLPIHRLSVAPLDVWAEQFEAKRVRALGGRPPKAVPSVAS